MLFLDVNVLVLASQPRSTPASAAVRAWLTAALDGPEQVAVNELVLSAFVRIVTNPRLYEQPWTPGGATAFAESVRQGPAARVVRQGPRHWSIFADLVTSLRLRGSDVPDAYLAALAVEAGATMVSLDRGFARFAGLRVLDPSR